MDQDPDEGATALHMRVRMASSAPHKAPPPAQPIPVDADMDVLSVRRIHADEQNDPTYAQRMKRWANDEGASNRHHRSGTGNAAGAVTGHHRTRGATAAKSTRQPPAKRGAATAPAPVRKTASALSAVADRSARFGA